MIGTCLYVLVENFLVASPTSKYKIFLRKLRKLRHIQKEKKKHKPKKKPSKKISSLKNDQQKPPA